jgi:hypothetical protein
MLVQPTFGYFKQPCQCHTHVLSIKRQAGVATSQRENAVSYRTISSHLDFEGLHIRIWSWHLAKINYSGWAIYLSNIVTIARRYVGSLSVVFFRQSVCVWFHQTIHPVVITLPYTRSCSRKKASWVELHAVQVSPVSGTERKLVVRKEDKASRQYMFPRLQGPIGRIGLLLDACPCITERTIRLVTI